MQEIKSFVLAHLNDQKRIQVEIHLSEIFLIINFNPFFLKAISLHFFMLLILLYLYILALLFYFLFINKLNYENIILI